MKRKNVVLIVFLAICTLSLGTAAVRLTEKGQAPDRGQSLIKTPAEAAGYHEYTQNEALAAFLSSLDAVTDKVAISIVGRSHPTETYGARDIYLVILSANGAMSPATLDRTKPTVLITAAQHGREQSAKEATLWLIRDIALGELRPL